MKKSLMILLVIPFQLFAVGVDSEFFEPDIGNKYQGRLLSVDGSYPIDEMKRLCAPFTGIDTAQIRCKKEGKGKGVVCDYKCSLHWLVD